MHRFVAATSLSKIFDLPEEKQNLIFTRIRFPDQLKKIHQLVVRDRENERAYAGLACGALRLAGSDPMPADQFNNMPASESKWLVILIRVEEQEGKQVLVDAAYLLAEWNPKRAESMRRFTGQQEGFLVLTPMEFREATDEEHNKPLPAEVQEAFRQLDVPGARIGRRMIEVKEEPKPWLEAAFK